jgi:hypothetical protein
MNKADFAELVFGFVYGVGTDADPVIATLKHYLTQYRYTAEEFRISEQLRSLELGMSIDLASPFEEMSTLMKACERAEDDRVLAVMAINDIASRRTEDEQGRPIARERTAHLIRSLKRPEEVHLLRQVYRPGFFLIGIADDDDSQIAYLKKEIGLDKRQAERLIERDTDNAPERRFTWLTSSYNVNRRPTKNNSIDFWRWFLATPLGRQGKKSTRCLWPTLLRPDRLS